MVDRTQLTVIENNAKMIVKLCFGLYGSNK